MYYLDKFPWYTTIYTIKQHYCRSIQSLRYITIIYHQAQNETFPIPPNFKSLSSYVSPNRVSNTDYTTNRSTQTIHTDANYIQICTHTQKNSSVYRKHLYETWIRDRSWTLSGISGRFERIANKSHTATSNCIRCRIQRMQIPFILSNFTDGRTLFKALAGMYASLVPANCMAGVLDVRNADRSTWSSVFDYSCGLCRFFVGSRCIFRILI